ncbi:hypothetical protein KBD09_01345 [Candidatus Woesebacteria bacterium]|nr:hypothetical protein [Candidatus Woesebacteria bacterium]
MTGKDYIYTVCGTEELGYYVVLHDAVTGQEVGYMRRDGTATPRENLKETFTTREEARGKASVKWGYSL